MSTAGPSPDEHGECSAALKVRPLREPAPSPFTCGRALWRVQHLPRSALRAWERAAGARRRDAPTLRYLDETAGLFEDFTRIADDVSCPLPAGVLRFSEAPGFPSRCSCHSCKRWCNSTTMISRT